MGIESDKLVYDYLSRVGDLAQQRQLPSGDRMRLVARLRAEIEQRRAGAADTPATVRRILRRLGTPAEVVDAAGTGAPAPPAPEIPTPASGSPWPELPQQPSRTAREPLDGPARRGGSGLGAAVPAPRTEAGQLPAPQADGRAPAVPPQGPRPPHLAGEKELGPPDAAPDWWRIEPGPYGPGDSVPGFVGGIEIPEILKPPPREPDPAETTGDEPEETEGPRQDAEQRPGLLRRMLARRRRPAADTARPPLTPSLLLAAALLVAGAVLGSLIPLGLGWLIAYASRRLSRTEAKWAVLGLPGVVAAGAIVWLWGRVNERWGDPIPPGRMGAALVDTWPVALRAAAVASALYLVWRARRPPG